MISANDACEVCGVSEGYGHKPGCDLVTPEALGSLVADDLAARGLVGKRYPMTDVAVSKVDALLKTQRRVLQCARAMAERYKRGHDNGFEEYDSEEHAALCDALLEYDAARAPQATSEDPKR